MSFERSDAFFELRVVLPSNITAHVCLPAALLPPNSTVTLDQVPAAHSSPEQGQLCLQQLLGGGKAGHTVAAVTKIMK